MKKLFFLFPALILCFFIMSGQKSNDDDPRWNNPRTAINLSGEYMPLPSINNDIRQFTYSPKANITPIGVLVTFPNVRVLPSTVTQQSENPIVRNPANPLILFGSSNSAHGSFINSASYVSTDGGVTWHGSDTIRTAILSDQRGDPGPTIDKNGRFIFTHLSSTLNFGSVNGMAANYSTDNGLTWSASVLVASDPNVDKNLAGTDDSPTSPFYGNSYFAWTSFGTSPANGRSARTTDGGVTWSTPVIINATPSGHNAQGHDVAVAPNGNVFVVWTAGVTSSPFTEDFVGVAKSTDGGVTFTATENAFDDNGSRSGSFNGWGIRTNGFPRMAIDKSSSPRRGWIYVVTGELNLAPAGTDADVVLHRSTDNGATWSAGTRVNQDALNNGKVQWFPAVCVDDAGGLNVVYYDNRNFPSSGDSCAVFISRSLDGGSTFTDVEVSDHHFKPKPSTGFGGGYMGDYIGIAASVGKVVAIWMDDKANSPGFFNTWTGALQTAVYPLNPFNLVTPASGTRIVTSVGSTTPVTITWDTSATGATYKWIFGNPVVPPRRLTIPSSTNGITITLGALDALLAANGFTNNGSATDSAVGQYDVWAIKTPGATGPDSLKSTNGPRALTLRRQQVLVSPFALVSPPSGITVITNPVSSTITTFTWRKSGSGVNYKWLFKIGATYTDPATLRIQSNNGGLDTTLSIVNSQLDSIFAGLGVAPGDSVTGQWRVRAYATDSVNSIMPDRTITFRRATLLPLDQDFSSTTFPPPFWGLDAGGGSFQYWTRNAVSGYQVGTGSAKYDFWSAVSTTPLQTLTSNQFPPVTTPGNYLRFNYSHAFYLTGGALANDSCIIESSTNAGTTWTRLIGMGASQTLSSGVNSNPIMSTVGGPFAGAFTPSLASQWATKVYLMPVGTNKIRFVAKSDFGNNLYIDDVTSGTITGIGSPLSLVPAKYELAQNYPNPFNPATKINFSIAKQGLVTMKIYDILGKEIMTLVNEQKPAGNYSVEFNAGNFASGIYFYKIVSGNFTQIKRMMLVK